jgi:hypothetical protein
MFGTISLGRASSLTAVVDNGAHGHDERKTCR